MPVDILVGLQWGDEGKGKIIDILSPQYDIVARFQGGPNAGHTLVIDGNKFIFHTLPSGVIHPGTRNILGSGMVINPITFMKEIEQLNRHNIDYQNRIIISRNAHLITPLHIYLDRFYEARKAQKKIGSTLRGIGPAYQDKYARTGLKVLDIIDKHFQEKYLNHKRWYFDIMKEIPTEGLEQMEKEWFEAIAQMKGFEITDTEIYVHKALKEGKNILGEGAQGTLLDVNFGTYPYVTSSHTISSGCCIGLGIPPSSVRKVLGVFKAYTTRVGEGPFPTELKDETGKWLLEKGCEYGSTTGRPRRCGWPDLVALQYAILLNGVTELIITKADVLSGINPLKICTQYQDIHGQKVEFSDLQKSSSIIPIYDEVEGWNEDISGYTSYNELPGSFINYIKYIEKFVSAPVTIISVGPERKQTIFV